MIVFVELLLVIVFLLNIIEQSYAFQLSPSSPPFSTKLKNENNNYNNNGDDEDVLPPPFSSSSLSSDRRIINKNLDSFPPSRIRLNGVDHYIRDTGDPPSIPKEEDHDSTDPTNNTNNQQQSRRPRPPVMLFLHGLAGSTDSWEDIAPILYEQGGIRAIAIDRVGFGRTERPVPMKILDPSSSWRGKKQIPFPFPVPPAVVPSFLNPESIASLIEALPAPPPPPFLPKDITDFLPLNTAFATAIRRPSLLVPNVPWSTTTTSTTSRMPSSSSTENNNNNKYNNMNPYSSEFAVAVIGSLLNNNAVFSSSSSTTTSTSTSTNTTGHTTAALAPSAPRKLYIVGHSAGGPIALRAFLAALDDYYDDHDNHTDPTNITANRKSIIPAGVALIAPAVLDPKEEDPGIYDYEDDSTNHDQNNAGADADARKNDTTNKNDDTSSNAALRLSVLKAVLALPDVFGVPIVRRIYDGRNITEALLNQTYSIPTTTTTTTTTMMLANETKAKKVGLSTERVAYLANKYKSPVDEFPNEWDIGLLNVYRADLFDDDNNEDDNNNNNNKVRPRRRQQHRRSPRRLRGRELLNTVRDKMYTVITAIVSSSSTAGEVAVIPSICVISGDGDRVIPTKASKKVAEILSVSSSSSSCTETKNTTTNRTTYVEIEGTGHLPMDEKPQQMAQVLLDWIIGSS